jgi:hypothetical protein
MWYPLYLQRWVLIIFTITFTLLIVILETLLAISNRDNGLATPPGQLEYVWKYGPTTILTIIALSWDRVTFQIQMLAPWYRMQKSKTSADQSLLLDYLDMLLPTAILSALRRRDWAPAVALSVYLALQVVVALSTSLLDLRVTQIESTVLTELGTQFHDANADNIMREAGLAYITMAGISELQLPYPEGTNAQYAYQTPSQPPALGMSLQMNVDGFLATLDCKDAKLERHLFFKDPSPWFEINATFEVREGNCSIEVNSNLKLQAPKSFTFLNFVRVFSGTCGNAAIPSRQRTAIVIGRMGYSLENPDETDVDKIKISSSNLISSTQAICVPRYNLQTVTITQNGTSVAVEDASPGQDSEPLNTTTIYNLMLAQFNTILGGGSYGGQAAEIDLQDSSAITLDNYAVLVRSSELSQVPYLELADPTLWLTAIQRYFQKFCAQIAKTSLLERVPSTVTAARRQSEDRLIVSQPICHAIAAILGYCALHTIIILFSIPKHTSLDANPTSILGTAGMAREATSVILRLRD